MRVTATFSDGLLGQLEGRALGDEFQITARARIVSAEEALVEITSYGEQDASFVQGELEVRLLLSHGRLKDAKSDSSPQ